MKKVTEVRTTRFEGKDAKEPWIRVTVKFDDHTSATAPASTNAESVGAVASYLIANTPD